MNTYMYIWPFTPTSLGIYLFFCYKKDKRSLAFSVIENCTFMLYSTNILKVVRLTPPLTALKRSLYKGCCERVVYLVGFFGSAFGGF